MRKNGFLSISVVFTFFIAFLLMLVLIMTEYSTNRNINSKYKDDIRERLTPEKKNSIDSILINNIGIEKKDSNGNKWGVIGDLTTMSSYSTSVLATSNYVSLTSGTDILTFTCTPTTCKSNNANNHSTTSEVTFKVPHNGSYNVCYKISSESNFDKGTFLVDSTTIVNAVSGEKEECISLGYVTTDNVLKAKYRKDSSVNKGDDAFSFYLEQSEEVNSAEMSTGIRYYGKDPNNYISFNGELWRIVGLFDENNHGVEGKNLVKIVRNEPIANTLIDYKQTGVGSSTSSYGSNDWSDAQLMMMLNPKDYLNSGYKADNSKTHNYTIASEDITDQNGRKIYKNMGAYFNSNVSYEAYKPSVVTNAADFSPTAMTIPRLSNQAQNMVEEVKWYLYTAPVSAYDKNTMGSAKSWYKYERNLSDISYVPSAKHPVYWVGKVGLLYPSDYGFSTSGSSNESSSKNREKCVDYYSLNHWDSECANNSYLLYNGNNTKISQFLITPSSTTATFLEINSTGYIGDGIRASYSRNIKPTLYLKENILIKGGDGSKDSPYIIDMEEEPLNLPPITKPEGRILF